MQGPLSPQELSRMNRYWRAANYLAAGQIYLHDNPLLREPLKPEHIKPRLLGHWGTTPGLNFIYVQINRLIKQHDLDAICVTGPGHGAPDSESSFTSWNLLESAVPSFRNEPHRPPHSWIILNSTTSRRLNFS